MNEESSSAQPEAEEETYVPSPSEYSRRALNQARARAREMGIAPTNRFRGRRDVRDRSTSAPGYSGAHPDPRDPQGIEKVLARVMGDLGWSDGIAMGRVMADWENIVGEAVAEHCTPLSFDEGVLIVRADSSAWAAQMRYLTPVLIGRIHEEIGRNLVTKVEVKGPATVSWTKGKRTVKWRGPRDTYG
ncbi:DUF721 domain-containing protein [Dermabacteraceae bacterium TAE3-ERU27]|nr:DUF721 domain-containing protein [Dermabacteraceae bacterium TAE3-ERU27]